MYTKFGLNRSICFQDIEQKINSDDIQGPLLYCKFAEFDLIQAFMHVLVTCKNEEDQIENEGARIFSQDFSHYKSIGIFPVAQGQLTLQSTVRSGQISNSSKAL